MTEQDDERIVSTATLNDDYDSPWKNAVEHYFPEFMAFYFPDAYAKIDWSKEPVFLDQELRAVVQDAELGKRFVDKLVRVTVLNGDETGYTSTLKCKEPGRLNLPSECLSTTIVFMIVIIVLLPVWQCWRMSMSSGNQLLMDLQCWAANIPWSFQSQS